MDSADIMILLIAVGIVVGALVLRIVLRRLLNKGIDAARNAHARAQNRNHPPREESLAARYGQPQATNPAQERDRDE